MEERRFHIFVRSEFSAVMKENERMFLKSAYAGKNARAVFLTGSGTSAMEATVMHTLSTEDKALVINGEIWT